MSVKKINLKLTNSRTVVLEILQKSGRPMKAYDILSAMQKEIPHAKPPTVYRALDYLIDNNLLRRVHSQNAYVCSKNIDARDSSSVGQTDVMLVCQSCGQVDEYPTAQLSEDIPEIAGKAGFSIGRTIECVGVCGRCN
jgi:Fur family zinc uptake transcriptional regulator